MLNGVDELDESCIAGAMWDRILSVRRPCGRDGRNDMRFW